MKILVVRFSSIGDIVLTSPVVRCIKQQVPDAEIHYLTKKAFESIVSNNPYVNRTFTIEKSVQEVLPELQNERYDFLVDLHNNIRTFSLKRKLKVPHATFPKLHVAKWLLVNFKVKMQPDEHIVDRYFKAVESLHVKNDKLPCDFFVSPEDEVDPAAFSLLPQQFVSFAIGAQFATKRMPLEKMVEVLGKVTFPVVLLGGKMDAEIGESLKNALPAQNIVNTCGNLSLRQSASLVRQSATLLTHDTGLMHIASAFQIPIVSVWGNTVPAFGMYPYYPVKPDLFSIHGVEDLPCRPCSKIGFQSCPKKHFKCMHLQNSELIAADVNERSKAITRP